MCSIRARRTQLDPNLRTMPKDLSCKMEEDFWEQRNNNHNNHRRTVHHPTIKNGEWDRQEGQYATAQSQSSTTVRVSLILYPRTMIGGAFHK